MAPSLPLLFSLHRDHGTFWHGELCSYWLEPSIPEWAGHWYYQWDNTKKPSALADSLPQFFNEMRRWPVQHSLTTDTFLCPRFTFRKACVGNLTSEWKCIVCNYHHQKNSTERIVILGLLKSNSPFICLYLYIFRCYM